MSKEVRFGDVLKSAETGRNRALMAIGLNSDGSSPPHRSYFYFWLEMPGSRSSRHGSGNWLEEDQWKFVSLRNDIE